MWSVLNCLDILSEDKDAATSSTADSLLKNIFCFNFVLGIMVPNSVLISIVYLHLLSTAVPAAAAHLPRAQPEVGAGRGGDQPVRGGDTLGCRVSATMVAVWMLCEKYRFDLANLASVPTSLVDTVSSPMQMWYHELGTMGMCELERNSPLTFPDAGSSYQNVSVSDIVS